MNNEFATSFISEIPPAIAVSDNEIIILNGNIESVAIPEDEPYTIGITTKSGQWYQAVGEQAVKFLNALPREFFIDSKNLLKLRDFNYQ